MSIYVQLEAALEESWRPVATAQAQGPRYVGKFGGHEAVLEKRKGRFYLTFQGQEYDLGRRATFSHAEGVIAKVLRKK